jgi:hypothetical protein
MMTAQSRQTKVLVTLLVSIMLCTIILNILGHNPPSAGAFCLSRYYSLVSVEKLVQSREVRRPGYFRWIEIYYSDDSSADRVASGSNMPARQSASLGCVSGREDIDCHFIIHNGYTGIDGKIEPTEKWKKQLPAVPRSDDNMRHSRQSEQTVYIRVEIDNRSTMPTNFQIKRLYALVEELSRELNIMSDSVFFPNNWQY